MQNENNFCKVSIFLGLEGIKVGVGAVMDKENAKDWQYSGRKIGTKLPTVVHLGEANGVF